MVFHIGNTTYLLYMADITYVRLPELRGWYWKRMDGTAIRFLHNKSDSYVDVDVGYKMEDDDVNVLGIWMSDLYNMGYVKGREDEYEKQSKARDVSG